MEPSVKTLKKQRGGCRAAVTGILSNLDNLLQSDDTEVLEGQLGTLSELHERIKGFSLQIQSMLEDESQISEEYKEYSERDSEMRTAIRKLERAIVKQGDQAGNPTDSQRTHAQNSKDVRLPKLTLPTFDGDLLGWLSFWDVFSSSVHDTDLDDIKKLQYLRGQLHGDAYKLIEGMPIVASSYPVAVKLLQGAYGNTEQLKIAHALALLQIKKPDYKVFDLTQFRADMECHTRSLETLDISLQEFIVIILRSKLPANLLDKIRTFNLDGFKEQFNTELNVLLNSNGNAVNVAARPEGTLSFTTSSGYDVKERGTICRLCQRPGHFWSKCLAHKTAKSRVDRARVLRLCTYCLQNHGHGNCTGVSRPCIHCGGKHYDLLCLKTGPAAMAKSQPKTSKRTSSQMALPRKKEEKTTSTNTLAVKSKTASVVLPTVMIPLKTKTKKSYMCRAMLDQCSERTFICKDILPNLKYEIVGKETHSLRGFTGETETSEYDIVDVYYWSKTRLKTLRCIAVNKVPTYDVKGMEEVIKKLKCKGIKLPTYQGENQACVDILLGADHYYDVVRPGFRKVSGITLLPTLFGFAISGPVPRDSDSVQVESVSVLRVAHCCSDPILKNGIYNEVGNIQRDFDHQDQQDPKSGYYQDTTFDLEKFWKLDQIGICNEEMGYDENLARDKFIESVTYHPERRQYEVRLPWISNRPSLPTNYGLALGRLRSLQKRLQDNPATREAYKETFQIYEELGFIERVNPHDKSEGAVHYLAHHGIAKDSPTTPIRVVFDCSARSGKGPSLNDCLLTGPSLVSDLVQQLIRFRFHNWAMVADIEKAFLMVSLHPNDRDAVRFLWLEDVQDPESPLIIYRFAVVLFGATCSQYLLNATIDHHLSLHNDVLTQQLRKGLYIDNLQLTCNNQQDLISLYNHAVHVFGEAHLHLREWISNNKTLNNVITREGVSATDIRSVHVLGMKWDSYTDMISYAYKEPTPPGNHTKRTLLSGLSRFFDPLGLAMPVTIRARVLMQDIWKTNIGWDDELNDELREHGQLILQDYARLSEIEIPRIICTEVPVELHAFCDASQRAYGVVIYLVNAQGSALVMARARVCPIRGLTVPRAELTAMLLGARSLIYVSKLFDMVDHFYLWGDSQIALSWIFSQRQLPVFVRNRVDELRSHLKDLAISCHYISTDSNPADLLTRGISTKSLLSSSIWWSGPDWLAYGQVLTPWNSDSFVPQEELELVISTASVDKEPKISLFDWSRFSSYDKAVKTVARVQHFIAALRSRLVEGVSRQCLPKGPDTMPGNSEAHIAANCLTNSLINSSIDFDFLDFGQAEYAMVKLVQKEGFPTELKFLLNPTNKKPALVRQLDLTLDNRGLIISQGRLQFVLSDSDSAALVLMPSNHDITKLLVQRIHETSAHLGVHYTVSKLRQHWWVPRARQVVRGVLRRCVVCRRLKGKPFQTGVPPPLPSFRVSYSRPFNTTGVDYTGAFKVRDGQKIYILLFTCAATRAVHIEICDSMGFDDFMLALRRFAARRSLPSMMLSDNAPTFKMAAEHLQSLSRNHRIKDYLRTNHCRWLFIPARAPWFGGMWERCIGIIKNGLKAAIGRALLSKSEFTTVVTEMEALVNDRPITYVYDSRQEPRPLTPSHLLCGREVSAIPSIPESTDSDFTPASHGSVTRRYLFLQGILADMRRRWENEYLISLRERSFSGSHQGPSPVAVGDVVLVSDEGKPRIFWRMGVVTRLHSGVDGIVRSVSVKTSSGLTTRPLQKLYPLELRVDESAVSTTVDSSAGPGDTSVNDGDRAGIPEGQAASLRPVREAAAQARSRWQEQQAAELL